MSAEYAPQLFVAVIADIVNSKRLERQERTSLSEDMGRLLAKWGSQPETAAAFVISRGDEFEGLLAEPTRLPDILWDIAVALPDCEVRIGVGCGEIYTPLAAESSDEVDGPVYHRARQAIEDAGAAGHLGGDFIGFGDPWDRTLGAMARALYSRRIQWTDAQRNVATELRDGREQVRIAEALGVSRQNISKHAAAAEWRIHADLETAFRAVLNHAWSELQTRSR